MIFFKTDQTFYLTQDVTNRPEVFFFLINENQWWKESRLLFEQLLFITFFSSATFVSATCQLLIWCKIVNILNSYFGHGKRPSHVLNVAICLQIYLLFAYKRQMKKDWSKMFGILRYRLCTFGQKHSNDILSVLNV